MSRKTVGTVEREREREREQCLAKTVFGFAVKEGNLSKLASKKINQKQNENEYKWKKRVDCI